MLSRILHAIEKIAEEDNKKTNTAIAGAAGAGIGAGASTLVRKHLANSIVDNFSNSHVHYGLHKDAMEPKIKVGLPPELIKKMKSDTYDAIGKSKVSDILKDKNNSTKDKIKFLLAKKRIMMPLGAGLAAGGYLLSRKNEDK